MKLNFLDKEKKDKNILDSEKQNAILRRRLSRCKERLVSILSLYEATPLGWITVDKANIVREVDKNFCALLDATPEKIIGKPVSLFINKENIVLFFAHRNHVFANKTREIFDLRFHRQGTNSIHCRVECKLVKPETSRGGEMGITVADISELRQMENDLQYKDDLLNIILSLSRDLNNAPESEYEHVVNYCLKTVGLFTGADRCFICPLEKRDSKIFNMFEWYSHKSFSKKGVISGVDAKKFQRILTDMRRNKIVLLQDLRLLSSEKKEEYEAFHAPGVKSLLTVPIMCSGAAIGIFGLDAVYQTKSWNIETTNLLKHISESFVNLMIRQRFLQLEDSGARLSSLNKNNIFAREKSGRTYENNTGLDPLFGTAITEIEDDRKTQKGQKNASQYEWSFSRGKVKDIGGLTTLRKNESNIFNIVCPRCGGEIKVGYSQIKVWGHIVEARCPCGKQFQIKIEAREAYRKSVHLNGFFIKENPLNESNHKNITWGDIIITNISKKGMGFRALNSAGIQKGDSIKVKFKLDNTLGSTIEKNVAVKKVSGNYIGCVFTKADKYDVTLGFYLM